MTISDPKFGAELITQKGRINKFDAAECMVNYIKEESSDHKKLYVISYDKPKKLQPVDSLQFIISPDFRSPMGANLAAFLNPSFSDKGYQMLSWDEIMQRNFDMGHMH